MTDRTSLSPRNAEEIARTCRPAFTIKSANGGLKPTTGWCRVIARDGHTICVVPGATTDSHDSVGRRLRFGADILDAV